MKKQAKEKKKINNKKVIAISILLLILASYLIYVIYLLIKQPTNVFTIEKGKLYKEETDVGYVIRHETVVRGENYKNGMENAKPFNIQKVWKRILRPFFGVQLFIISVYAITHYHSETFQEMAVKVLSKGGYGAGSYYPWIYIQFAILLSLLAKWLSKLSNVKI